MFRAVTLVLPSELVERVQAVAARTCRRVEEVLEEWVGRAETEFVEELSDAEVLSLCDSQLSHFDQEDLSDLLERQQDGLLQEEEKAFLEDLLRRYRCKLIRKARAWKTAVSRGLRPPLGEP